MTIYPRPTESPSEILIASRDIYATHILDASLGLLLLTDRPSGSGPTWSYLTYVNHSWIDALHGFLGGIRRRIIEHQQRDSMESYLREARTRMETAYRASSSAR